MICVFRRKQTRPEPLPYIPKPRFYVRTFPTSYKKFYVKIVDRDKPNFTKYYRQGIYAPEPKNERTITRGGFRSRGAAIDFAYRVIKIRTKWEAYVKANSTTLEVDG